MLNVYNQRKRRYTPYLVATSPAAAAGVAYAARSKLARFAGFANAQYSAWKRKSSAQPAKKRKVAQAGKITSNTGKVSRPYKKGGYRRKQPGGIAGLMKDVNRLKKAVAADTSRYTWKSKEAGNLISPAVNQCAYKQIMSMNAAGLETVLSEGQFFDPAAPGTLVKASLVSGTYARKVQIRSQFVRCVFRNNYQVPCKLRVYIYQVKDDTSKGPLLAMTEGLANNASGALTITDPGIYPTDGNTLGQLWTTKKSSSVCLQPGQQLAIAYSTPGFSYDPSLTDGHPDSYQVRNKSIAMLARIEGINGHDGASSVGGILRGGVDYILDKQWRVEYESSADLDYIVYSQTLNAMDVPVVSSKPVSDNIAYTSA